MKITAYEIQIADTAESLERLVMEAILNGWEPIGGVSVAVSDYHSVDHEGYTADNLRIMFCQALVKREPTNP